MKSKTIIAACALAIGLGAVCAPTAAAQGIDLREYPCSDDFALPWELDAWNGTHKVAFSPYGTENIHCVSFHGWTSAYQFDPQGRKHNLNAPSGVVGAFASKLYFWDPAAY